MSKVRVFLSYAREDQSRALKLRDDLESFGVEVWFDVSTIKPGQVWTSKVETAIQECDYFLALFSSLSTAKRGFFHTEVRIALAMLRSKGDDSDFFIPVLLDTCEPPYPELAERHFADLSEDWKGGVSKILATVLKPGPAPRENPSQC